MVERGIDIATSELNRTWGKREETGAIFRLRYCLNTWKRKPFLLGSLNSDVFERRASTGTEPFSL